MSLTAYVRIRGSYLEEPVSYALGPVWVDKTLIDGYYTKTGFRPSVTSATWSASLNVMMGDGQNNGGMGITTGNVAAFLEDSSATSPVIAVPDEMTPSQALRDRSYTMSYLTFYGAAATGITVTGRSSNTLTLATGHGLYNGQLVTLTTTSALPSGLTTDTLYYIVSRAAGAVSFALTPGGSAVTISDAGTGTHKIVPFAEVGSFARNLNPRWSNGVGTLVS